MAKPKLKVEKARWIGVFDGSGKEDQQVLVVAGFVSRTTDWQAFEAEWTDRLKQDDLKYFHMVDFAGSRGQFRGWQTDETRRRRLLGDLIEIIKSHVYRKFGSSIENDQFYRLSLENQKSFSLNAYTLAARSCVADVAKWLLREGLSHLPTAYIFEEGDEGEGKLSERMLQDGHSKPYFLAKQDRTEPDGTAKNGCVPLQAADILAYELAKAHRDVLEGKGPKKFRWALQQFDKIPVEPGYYSPKNLQDLDEKLTELNLQKNTGADTPENPEDRL